MKLRNSDVELWSLCDMVSEKLLLFGYEDASRDEVLITFAVEKVQNSVKNDCNLRSIPRGLRCCVVDMACGEFLATKYNLGQLVADNLDLDKALSSVKLGDATVSFADGVSDDVKLRGLIEALQNSGKGELACYRKIRW